MQPINVSRISSRSLIGKLLRAPLRLIPADTVFPIVQGKLRGMRWITGSSSHGCWLGSYEHAKQILISSKLRPGGVFFDIGAHVGFYSLLASALVGPAGKVVAFEPLPANLAYLNRHIQLNNLLNIRVFTLALTAKSGQRRFRLGSSSSMGHLDDAGSIVVETSTLDQLVANGDIPLPDWIKIDVEGAEADVILGGKQLLTDASPTIFLATHGKDVHSHCLSLLDSYGYACSSADSRSVLDTDEIVATKRL